MSLSASWLYTLPKLPVNFVHIPFLSERLSLDSTTGLATTPSSQEPCTGLEGTEMQDPMCLDPGLEMSRRGVGGKKGCQCSGVGAATYDPVSRGSAPGKQSWIFLVHKPEKKLGGLYHDQVPGTNNLKGGKTYLSHSFRGVSISWRRTDPNGAAHTMVTKENKCLNGQLSHPPSSIPYRTPAYKMLYPCSPFFR